MQVDLSGGDLHYRYQKIYKAIALQRELIYSKFGLRPEYVILGVEAEKVLSQYASTQAIAFTPNPSLSLINSPSEGIIRAYFDLIPIVDATLPLKLPKDFVQVVVPEGAYS